MRERDGKIEFTDSYSFKKGRVSKNRKNIETREKVKQSKEVVHPTQVAHKQIFNNHNDK